jgi:hypothetical protein
MRALVPLLPLVLAVALSGCASEQCIVTGLGNKVCGADAAAWCEINEPMREEFRNAPASEADPTLKEQIRQTDEACDAVRQ